MLSGNKKIPQRSLTGPNNYVSLRGNKTVGEVMEEGGCSTVNLNIVILGCASVRVSKPGVGNRTFGNQT